MPAARRALELAGIERPVGHIDASRAVAIRRREIAILHIGTTNEFLGGRIDDPQLAKVLGRCQQLLRWRLKNGTVLKQPANELKTWAF